MVKGALAKNRKNRRKGRGFPLENRVKIFPIENTSFEGIHNKFNSGCLIVLTGFGNYKGLVYETSRDEKSLMLASKASANLIELSKLTFNYPAFDKTPKEYFLTPIRCISKDAFIYPELNKRLEIVNQH